MGAWNEVEDEFSSYSLRNSFGALQFWFKVLEFSMMILNNYWIILGVSCFSYIV